MSVIDQPSASASASGFDVADRGLLLADGVFTTALVRGGRMIFEEAHLARLRRDAEALGIPYPGDRVRGALNRALENASDGALRITVTRGCGARGLAVHTQQPATVLATLRPVDLLRQFQPTRLHISGIRRNETSPASQHKTLAYLDNILATEEARSAGCDDALFLNTKGELACAATANIFVRIGDDLYTPPVSDGALPGVTRQAALQIASDVGLRALEQSLHPDQLSAADDVFLTNSLRGLSPVTAIDEWACPAFSLTSFQDRLRRLMSGEGGLQ